MDRISSTIDLEDKVLARDTVIRRDPILHETPHQIAPETHCSEDILNAQEFRLILS